MTRSKDELLKTFNNVAVDYDMKYEGWSKDTHPFILDELKSEPFTSILDVGCGTGTMLSMVTKRARKAGLDISPQMLTKARQKLGDGIDLRVGDSEVLPWSDDSFDVVTCNLSFHHYEHPEIVLKEMHHVLRSGGRVVICDIHQPFFQRLFLNLFMRFNHEGDAHIYSGKKSRRY